MVTLANRVKQTITAVASSGTGTLTLGAASAGFQTLADANVASGSTVRYTIEGPSNAWELGSGVYTASGTTLTRTPSESSNSGNAITATTDSTVFVTAAASDIGPAVYANLNDLIAATGMAVGDMALVTATNKMYVYLATGWWLLATLTNTSPTAISGVSATYNLAQDGTATVITLSSTDPEGFPLTYSYTVSSGSLGSTATVAQGTGANANVFTITPSTSSSDEGTFSLTFSVSDGNSVTQAVTAITLSFALTWSNSQSQPIIAWSSSTYTGSGTQHYLAVPLANSVTTIDGNTNFYYNGATSQPTSAHIGAKFGSAMVIVNQSVTFNGQTFNQYARSGPWSGGTGTNYWIRFGGSTPTNTTYTWDLGTGLNVNSQGWIRVSTAVSNNASGINTP